MRNQSVGRDLNLRGLRSGIADLDPDAEVKRRRLRVLGEDLPIASLIEDPGVAELVLGVVAAAAGALIDEPLVGKLALGIMVAPGKPGRGRGRIEVPPIVLGVLAVVALGSGQPEHALLEDGVLSVPKGQREAQVLIPVADSGESVIAPAIGPGAGVIVREIDPGLAVGAVVLPRGAPGALAQVRADRLPVAGRIHRLAGQSCVLLRGRRFSPIDLCHSGILHPLLLISARAHHSWKSLTGTSPQLGLESPSLPPPSAPSRDP